MISIRRRLFSRLIWILAVIWAACSLLVLIIAPIEYEEAQTRRIVNTAQLILAFTSEIPDHTVARPILDKATASKLELDELLIVISRNGHLLYSSASADKSALLTLPLEGTTHLNGFQFSLQGLEDPITQTRVVLGVEVNESFFASFEIAVLVIFLLLISMAMILGAAIYGVRNGLLPLEEFARDVENRDQENLSPVSTESTPSELQPVATALNGLMARLKHALEQEREFVSNAAHELRTPMTAIRAQVERFDLSELDETDRTQYANILKATERANRLISQLLDLSRSQSISLSSLPIRETDLVPLLQQALADQVARANKRQVELSLEAPDECRLQSQPDLLEVILRNLIENAVKYAASPGRVSVLLMEQNGRIFIEVEDDGPGLSSDEFARAMDRFQRLNRTDSNGAGLGLAIVAELCARLGYTITQQAPGQLGGLCLRLDLGPHS